MSQYFPIGLNDPHLNFQNQEDNFVLRILGFKLKNTRLY